MAKPPKFDITCPATNEVIAEFNLGDDVGEIVDKHMAESHPDWERSSNVLEYLKIGEANCPLCGSPAKSSHGVDIHVRSYHPGYVKRGELDYRFDEVLYEDHVARHRAASTQSYYRTG